MRLCFEKYFSHYCIINTEQTSRNIFTYIEFQFYYPKILNLGPGLISGESLFWWAYIPVGLYPGGLKSGMNFLLEPNKAIFLALKSYLKNLKTDKIK